MAFEDILLAIILATLAAIIYTLRVVLLMNNKLDKLLGQKGMK